MGKCVMCGIETDSIREVLHVPSHKPISNPYICNDCSDAIIEALNDEDSEVE